jgi:FkbM family methyltransferase
MSTVLGGGVRRAFRPVVTPLLRRLGYELVRHPNPCSLEAHLLYVFKRLRINCVLDVGARIGEYGGRLRAAGYRGRIVSFEPVSDSYRQLQSVSSASRGWTAHNFALGDTNERRSINVTKNSVYSSFRNISEFSIARDPMSSVEHSEVVCLRRLDSVISEVLESLPNPRLFLKLDTQGYDLAVIRGASGCLDGVFGIQTELSLTPLYDDQPGWLESIQHITGLGYSISSFFPVAWADAYEGGSSVGLQAIELDCVLVR